MSAKATSHACSVVVALLMAGGAVAPARAQSLADIAKKEEDRRKTVAAASKVYTNKDLSPVPAGSPPPAPEAAPSSPGAAKTAEGDGKGTPPKDPAEKAPVKDQAYWAGRLKTLQDKLARDQDYGDAMQTRINSLTTDFVNRDDPAQRAVIETNRQKSIAELARLTKSVQDDKKALADFLEEARRAGIPPGWLR
jgi:hypothetical protein